MKKVFKIVPYIFMITIGLLAFVSCENDLENEKQSISAKQLVEQRAFQEIASQMKDFTDLIMTSINNQDIPAGKVRLRIKEIENSGLTIEKQSEQLSELLNINFTEKAIDNYNVISKNLDEINNRYVVLEEELLTEALGLYFEEENSNLTQRGCGLGFYVCSGAALSASILCASGCTAGTAGLGGPACAVLCSAIYTYGIQVCSEKYCDEPLIGGV